MKPKTFEFNTGRLYKADGQRIVCRYMWSDRVRSHVIAFTDTARGIWGWLPYTGRSDGAEGERHMREAVLAAYDHHAYSSDNFEHLDPAAFEVRS